MNETNDNEYWYAALDWWIKQDPEVRFSKRLAELYRSDFSEILQKAQQLKGEAIAARRRKK